MMGFQDAELSHLFRWAELEEMMWQNRWSQFNTNRPHPRHTQYEIITESCCTKSPISFLLQAASSQRPRLNQHSVLTGWLLPQAHLLWGDWCSWLEGGERWDEEEEWDSLHWRNDEAGHGCREQDRERDSRVSRDTVTDVFLHQLPVDDQLTCSISVCFSLLYWATQWVSPLFGYNTSHILEFSFGSPWLPDSVWFSLVWFSLTWFTLQVIQTEPDVGVWTDVRLCSVFTFLQWVIYWEPSYENRYMYKNPCTSHNLNVFFDIFYFELKKNRKYCVLNTEQH